MKAGWFGAFGAADKVIEIGSGKALTGMIRRINKDINCYNIGSSDDLNKFLSTDSEG